MNVALRSFGAALVVLAVLDGLWLGLISPAFYKARIGPLLLDRPIWVPAILFYLVHAGGIAIFAVPAALSAGTWPGAILYGALFGACVYAAYDLTNLATLRGWSVSVTIVDLCWGAFATAAATVAAYALVKAS